MFNQNQLEQRQMKNMFCFPVSTNDDDADGKEETAAAAAAAAPQTGFDTFPDVPLNVNDGYVTGESSVCDDDDASIGDISIDQEDDGSIIPLDYRQDWMETDPEMYELGECFEDVGIDIDNEPAFGEGEDTTEKKKSDFFDDEYLWSIESSSTRKRQRQEEPKETQGTSTIDCTNARNSKYRAMMHARTVHAVPDDDTREDQQWTTIMTMMGTKIQSIHHAKV